MSNQIMITPEDILKQREESRKSLILAHSANSSGAFFARPGCSCYNCRDALDPTGEEDARIANEMSLMPSEPPMLERQNAICLDCQQSHLSNEVCRPRSISLPPPTMGLRRHPFSPNLSPIIGLVSPRSLSDSSYANSQDQFRVCFEMEQRVKMMLLKLKRSYKRLEGLLAEDDNFNSHDEMAANDMFISQTMAKIDAIDNFLEELNKE
jgi:hypothetical protein